MTCTAGTGRPASSTIWPATLVLGTRMRTCAVLFVSGLRISIGSSETLVGCDPESCLESVSYPLRRDAPTLVDAVNARLRTGASLRDGVAGAKDEVMGRFCIMIAKCLVRDIRRLDFVIVTEYLRPG